MFFKTSKLRHGKWLFKKIKKCPLKKIHIIGNWNLEKTLLDRHKYDMAIGVNYLTLKRKQFLYSFSF